MFWLIEGCLAGVQLRVSEFDNIVLFRVISGYNQFIETASCPKFKPVMESSRHCFDL